MSIVPTTKDFVGGLPNWLIPVIGGDREAEVALYRYPYMISHPKVVSIVQGQLKKLGYQVSVTGNLDDATAHGLRDTFGLEWEMMRWYDLIWHLYPQVGLGIVDIGGSLALTAIAVGVMFFLTKGMV